MEPKWSVKDCLGTEVSKWHIVVDLLAVFFLVWNSIEQGRSPL